jgi:2'-5' RNA ligase
VADDTGWYWGVVLRASPVDELLRRIAQLEPPRGVNAQAVGTGHVTLFYAPLRGPGDDVTLADRIRPCAQVMAPFELELRGLGEFVSAQRVVAWLGVADGTEKLRELRSSICAVDADSLPHSFHPHCTLAYGDDPEAYARFRPALREAVTQVRIRMPVDRIWIAGFPKGAHPARGLGYRLEVPLLGGAVPAAP